MEKIEQPTSKIDQIKMIILELSQNERHTKKVCQYALELGKKLKADLEILEISAWLHDVGRFKFWPKEHNFTGAQEAEKILQELSFKESFIEKAKHCILAHSGKIPFQSLEAEILANADAMEHFDDLPGWFVATQKMGMEEWEAKKWITKKLARDWDKKLTLPEARNVVWDKYQVIKVSLH